MKILLCLLLLAAPAWAQNALDERLFTMPGQRAALLRGVDGSLRYLASPRAAAIYARQGKAGGPSRMAVQRALRRLRVLLKLTRSSRSFEAALRRDFALWQREAGPVHFTAYFEPIYEARLRPDARFRYPIYGLPDMHRWPRPHPTRLELEGADGLQPSPLLRGHAIAYLPDRLQAYLVQVQGAARVRLPGGKIVSLGYAGRTDWAYTGVGRELINDGKIRFEDLTQQAMLAYFRAHPEELDDYIVRNRRFVFFRPTHGRPATGALGVPLVAGRSIATDKALLPPGAPALVQIELHNPLTSQIFGTRRLVRVALDHDTGGAMRGARRVDIFMGSGPAAGERAGALNALGSLGYLLLKADAARLKRGQMTALP